MTTGRETGGLSAERSIISEAAPRSPSFAEQLCRRIHPTRWQVKTQFGACDDCKTYVLAVLESDWLAERDDRLATRAAQPDAGTALDEVERRLAEVEWADWALAGPDAGRDAIRIVREVRAAHGQDESGEGELSRVGLAAAAIEAPR